MFYPITRAQLIMFYVKLWSLIEFTRAGAHKLQPNAYFPHQSSDVGISCQVLEPYKSYLGGNPGSGSRSFYLDQCFCVLRIKALLLLAGGKR